MIKDNEIEELKKHLDVNGKLVISDNLTDKQKERYTFINNLDIDLIAVLNRNTEIANYDDEFESLNDNDQDDDYEDDETLTDDLDETSSSIIEENDDVSVENLNDFF